MVFSIVLVCGNVESGALIEAPLRSAGFNLRCFPSAINAVGCFGTSKLSISCLITETRSFGVSGWDLARIARQSNRRIGVVYLVDGGDGDWLVQGVPESEMLDPARDAARMSDIVASAIRRVAEAG